MALACTLAACAGSDAAVRAEEARARLSESEGGRRVLEAIGAHGGLEAWFGAATSAYAWEYSNFGSDLRFESYLVADNRTRRVYHQLRSYGTPGEVRDVDARFAWDGEEAWMSPASQEGPNPRFWSLTGYYFESIPFVMADPGVNFVLLSPENLEGVSHDRVMAYYDEGIGDSPGDRYTMYIDQDTNMVDAVLYTVTFGRAYEAGDEPPGAIEGGTLLFYEDYTTVDGLRVPTRFRGYAYEDGVQGEQRSEAWAREISFSEPFDESMLAMPEDGRIQPYDVR